MGGKSSALLIDCTLQGAKCGLCAFGDAHGELQLCSIENCGEQGVKLMDSARLELDRWVAISRTVIARLTQLVHSIEVLAQVWNMCM